MVVWEIPVLCVLAVLCGMKSISGWNVWSGKDCSYFDIWSDRRIYLLSAGWMIFYGWLWFGFGKSAVLIRSVDMMCTYGILALIDGKCRIVLDSVLIIFFAGQMFLAAFSMSLALLLNLALTGILFGIVVFAFSWFSRERMGMGDARLLGVTAMTAGWGFVLQILVIAVVCSFVYSIWLMAVCKKGVRTEFPFVPFLAAGMAVYLVYMVMCK